MDTGGLQLIPGTRRTVAIKRPGQNKLLVIGILVGSLLVAAGLGMSLYKASVESNLRDTLSEIQEIESQRDRQTEQKIKILASQIKVIRDALMNHSFWTIGLGKFENSTKNEVQFLALNVNAVDGKINMEALAPSYTLVARQIAALVAEPSISDIQLTKASSTTGNKIRFILAMRFDPNKMVKVK